MFWPRLNQHRCSLARQHGCSGASSDKCSLEQMFCGTDVLASVEALQHRCSLERMFGRADVLQHKCSGLVPWWGSSRTNVL